MFLTIIVAQSFSGRQITSLSFGQMWHQLSQDCGEQLFFYILCSDADCFARYFGFHLVAHKASARILGRLLKPIWTSSHNGVKLPQQIFCLATFALAFKKKKVCLNQRKYLCTDAVNVFLVKKRGFWGRASLWTTGIVMSKKWLEQDNHKSVDGRLSYGIRWQNNTPKSVNW